MIVARRATANGWGCYSYLRVRHYEIGNSLPTLNFMLKFKKIFGCSIDEMIKVPTEKI